MEFDEIPELPKIKRSDLEEEDQESILNKVRNSKSKFIFYEDEEGKPQFVFDKLDERLYANLVVKLSCPLHINVFDFIKLSLEGARMIKLNTKNGYLNAVRVEKHIEQQNKS